MAAIEAIGGPKGRFKMIASHLSYSTATHSCTKTLVLGKAGDYKSLEEATQSKFPEAAAVANALLAERDEDMDRAVKGWRDAIESNADSVLISTWQYFLAKALRVQDKHDEVIAACGEVIQPRRFVWAWGPASGQCLAWSAQASESLGNKAKALTHWKRLVELRSKANDSDELVRDARAGLARLSP